MVLAPQDEEISMVKADKPLLFGIGNQVLQARSKA